MASSSTPAVPSVAPSLQDGEMKNVERTDEKTPQIVDDDEIHGAELVAFPPDPEYEVLSMTSEDGSG